MSHNIHYVNCARMNEKNAYSAQDEATRLSGRRGADKGNPTSTGTHLHGLNADQFDDDLYLLLDTADERPSPAANLAPGSTSGSHAVEMPTESVFEYLGPCEERETNP